MTTDDDVVAFLRAQLDLAEAHARKDLHVLDQASGGGQWVARYGYNLPYSLLTDDGEQEIGRLTATDGPQYHPSGHRVDGYEDRHQRDAALIHRLTAAARQRAERVLADVEAQRSVLAHASSMFGFETAEPDNRVVKGAAGAFRTMVRLLALARADQPGYREEWRPESARPQPTC